MEQLSHPAGLCGRRAAMVWWASRGASAVIPSSSAGTVQWNTHHSPCQGQGPRHALLPWVLVGCCVTQPGVGWQSHTGRSGADKVQQQGQVQPGCMQCPATLFDRVWWCRTRFGLVFNNLCVIDFFMSRGLVVWSASVCGCWSRFKACMAARASILPNQWCLLAGAWVAVGCVGHCPRQGCMSCF